MIYNFNRTPPPITGQTAVNEDIAKSVSMANTPWSQLRIASKSRLSKSEYVRSVAGAYFRTLIALLLNKEKGKEVFTFYPDSPYFARLHFFLLRIISLFTSMKISPMIHSYITYSECIQKTFKHITIYSPKPGNGLFYIPNTLRPMREETLLKIPAQTGSVKTIGFFSGNIRDKGIDRFIALAKKHPELKFIYGGKDWGFSGDNLSYFGFIKDENISAFFSKIDVFYFPSEYRLEFSPVVLLEAMCAGRIVVSSSFNDIHWMLPFNAELEEVIKSREVDRGKLYRAHYQENFSRTKRDLILQKAFLNE